MMPIDSYADSTLSKTGFGGMISQILTNGAFKLCDSIVLIDTCLFFHGWVALAGLFLFPTLPSNRVRFGEAPLRIISMIITGLPNEPMGKPCPKSL